MQNLKITWLKDISNCDGTSFYLLNGVAVLDDGKLVVADGGNDRICLLDKNGNCIKAIGERGFAKYKFKEPVGVFVSPNQIIYVADWHNHRIVMYDDALNYLGEFGHYGAINGAKSIILNIKTILKFLYFLGYKGSYIKYHFQEKTGKKTSNNRKFSVRLFLQGLIYWYHRNGSILSSMKEVFSEAGAMQKPNGVAFFEDKILTTQKDARCISVYNKDQVLRHIKQTDHYFQPTKEMKFGRLCRIRCDSQGFIYVCDERSIIWVLNTSFKLVNKITGVDSGVGAFKPFSCCFLGQHMLAVCGGRNFQIFHLPDGQLIYRSTNLGELHDIAYDGDLSRLYLADRSNSKILVFKIGSS